MELLLSATIMGLAGFDVFALPLMMAGLNAGAGRRGMVQFSLGLLGASVLGGVLFSQLLGNSMSWLASFFKQLPNYIWVGLDMVIILGLIFWLGKRLLKKETAAAPAKEPQSAFHRSMGLLGAIYATSSFPDPTFIALTVSAGHSQQLMLVMMAFIIWILLSQLPVFILTLMVWRNQHERFMAWLKDIGQRYRGFFYWTLNLLIMMALGLVVFDLCYFVYMGKWII